MRDRLSIVNRPELFLGFLALALHLWVNGSYGYFRDELYYIACGRHPAFGYTDQPPLIPLIAWASDAAFHSLRGLRLVPALACAATVALTAQAARMLGGGFYARWLAGLAVLGGGFLEFCGVTLSTDCLQPLAWLAIGLCVLKAQEGDDKRWWLAAGAIAGLAFLAKYTVALYLVSIAVGLLATRAAPPCPLGALGGRPRRPCHRRPEPHLAGCERLALRHPHRRARGGKEHPALARTVPGAGNPGRRPRHGPGVDGWACGLRAPAGFRAVALDRRELAFPGRRRGDRARPALLHRAPLSLADGGRSGRARGLAAALGEAGPGGVRRRRRRGDRADVPARPPIRDFIAYQHATGARPTTGERLVLADLPQYYADQFGWPEMAEVVGKAYQALPPEDRRRAVFFAQNYGDAAAIDFFGAPYGLPPAISAHENYFLWGPRGTDGSVVLILGGKLEDHLKHCRSVGPVGRFDHPLAMPYERDQTLWLCRDITQPLEQLWPRLRHFG